MLPEGLEARYRSLRRRPKERAALRAEREAAVARTAFGSDEALWIPPVPLHPPKNAAPPRPVEAPTQRDTLTGLDAEGRPVLLRSAFGLDGERPKAVLAHRGEQRDTFVLHARLPTWDGPRLEVVGFLTHADVSHVTWVDHDEAGRSVRFATAGVADNALGTSSPPAGGSCCSPACRRRTSCGTRTSSAAIRGSRCCTSRPARRSTGRTRRATGPPPSSRPRSSPSGASASLRC
jgi:hypothetical protein